MKTACTLAIIVEMSLLYVLLYTANFFFGGQKAPALVALLLVTVLMKVVWTVLLTALYINAHNSVRKEVTYHG